ncbi:MAG: rhomboid family intramembrane serine protease [Alphaproteobacteria bacterium]|nr:rhomboid family intramembrane serine protease [Alphaproteobacteria bacterium]
MIPIHDENPAHGPAVVTVLLIATCVVALLWLLSVPDHDMDWVFNSLGAIPIVVRGQGYVEPYVAGLPPQASLVTSLFLHAGLLHLAGNMLYLWVFGNNVEDRLGHFRFLVFYLLCGIAGTLVHVALFPDSDVPLVGASGAVSGVLGAYLLLFPLARVRVIVPPFFWRSVRLPAWLFLGLWFVFQSFLAANDVSISDVPHQSAEDGVAWAAHVGGFVTGMALVLLMRPKGVTLFHDFGGATMTPARAPTRSKGSVPQVNRSKLARPATGVKPKDRKPTVHR